VNEGSQVNVQAVVLTFLIILLTSLPLPAQDSSATPSLSSMSTASLLACASKGTCDGTDWDIADELRQRLSVDRLIALYPGQNTQEKIVIVEALYTAKGPKVEALMRRAAFSDLRAGQTDEDNHYYPLQYLAKLCDPQALKELNRVENYQNSYPVSCMQWQYTLAAFGKCGYKPAVPLLANSLYSACVNNIVAAQLSLRQLMPKSKCWKKAAASDDFQSETACYLNEYQTASRP
jgi:hypothetical protein